MKKAKKTTKKAAKPAKPKAPAKPKQPSKDELKKEAKRTMELMDPYLKNIEAMRKNEGLPAVQRGEANTWETRIRSFAAGQRDRIASATGKKRTWDFVKERQRAAQLNAQDILEIAESTIKYCPGGSRYLHYFKFPRWCTFGKLHSYTIIKIAFSEIAVANPEHHTSRDGARGIA